MSKKSMNVLGVVFDSKLNWSTHVAKAIVKAKKALIAQKLIKRFFSISEMRTLLDANFYSILYYNAVVWLTLSHVCFEHFHNEHPNISRKKMPRLNYRINPLQHKNKNNLFKVLQNR